MGKDKKKDKKDKKGKKDKKVKKDKGDKTDKKKDKKDKKGKKDKKKKKDKGGKRDLDLDPGDFEASDAELPVEEAQVRRQFEEATRGVSELTRDIAGSYQMGRAVKDEIIDSLHWLVDGAKAGDRLFFHYSGHGTQVADKGGDGLQEEDGMDEAICPADFRVRGLILDDQLHDILVEGVPEGAHLTAIMDCCHSGTALDPPYIYEAKSTSKSDMKMEEDKKQKKKKEKKKKKGKDKEKEKEKKVEGFHGHGDVVMFSGCDDSQVSADVVLEGSATGAVSFSLMTALITHGMKLSYADLLIEIKKILSARVKNVQYPQLTSNQANFDFGANF